METFVKWMGVGVTGPRAHKEWRGWPGDLGVSLWDR